MHCTEPKYGKYEPITGYIYNHCYQIKEWMYAKAWLYSWFDKQYKRVYGKTLNELLFASYTRDRQGMNNCTYYMQILQVSLLEQYLYNIYNDYKLYGRVMSEDSTEYHIYDKDKIECMRSYWYCKGIDIMQVLLQFGIKPTPDNSGIGYMEIDSTFIIG